MSRNAAGGLPRCSGGGAEWARGAAVQCGVLVAGLLSKMQGNWRMLSAGTVGAGALNVVLQG
jgi:hypothetical protein